MFCLRFPTSVKFLTRSQQFIGFIISCLHCKTTVARPWLGWSLPHASGGGFLLVRDPPPGAAHVRLGWGQASRLRVRCAGRVGSTVTLEQAGQGAEGSCRFFGLAAGRGLPLQTLVKRSGRDSALEHWRVSVSLGALACHSSLS